MAWAPSATPPPTAGARRLPRRARSTSVPARSVAGVGLGTTTSVSSASTATVGVKEWGAPPWAPPDPPLRCTVTRGKQETDRNDRQMARETRQGRSRSRHHPLLNLAWAWGPKVGVAVTDGVAVGVAVGDAAPDRRRSINRSPACHGCDATLHVSVPAVRVDRGRRRRQRQRQRPVDRQHVQRLPRQRRVRRKREHHRPALPRQGAERRRRAPDGERLGLQRPVRPVRPKPRPDGHDPGRRTPRASCPVQMATGSGLVR